MAFESVVDFGDESERRGRGRPKMARGPAPGEIEDGEYAPENFYTWASDARGHSHNYKVTVATDWQPVIEQTAHKYPAYKDYAAAFIRDAIFHRLKWLGDHSDDAALKAEIRRMQIEQESVREAEQVKGWEAYIGAADDRLAECKAKGYLEGVRREVERLAEYGEGLPEPFRGRAMKVAVHWADWLERQEERDE